MKMRSLETSKAWLGERQLQERNPQTFRAVLGGLHIPLAQKDPPRGGERGSLQGALPWGRVRLGVPQQGQLLRL